MKVNAIHGTIILVLIVVIIAIATFVYMEGL